MLQCMENIGIRDLVILGAGKPPPNTLGHAPISEIGKLKLGDRIVRFKQGGYIWYFRVYPADDRREKNEAFAFIAMDNGELGVLRIECP